MDIDPVLLAEEAEAARRSTSTSTGDHASSSTTAPRLSANGISTLEQWAATHASDPPPAPAIPPAPAAAAPAGPSAHMSVEQAMRKVVGPTPIASATSRFAHDYPPHTRPPIRPPSIESQAASQSRPNHTSHKSSSGTPIPAVAAPWARNTSSSANATANASASAAPSRPNGVTTPPYHPPGEVKYPTERLLNPYYHSDNYKPVLYGVSANNLFRPEFFPADMDMRLDMSCIWMGIDRTTLEPKYFVPASCAECSDPSVRGHCDRGYPKCGHCATSGKSCSPGTTWRYLRMAKKKSDDGKTGSKRSASHIEPHSHTNGNGNGGPAATPESGRGKRVRKKRRLSAEGQIDPDTLDDDGNPRAVDPSPSHSRHTQHTPLSHQSRSNNKGATKPRSSLPSKTIKPNQPMTKADEEYFRLLEENAKKPGLREMTSPCPVWSHTRRALCSATEYLRNPIRSEGASVEVGEGGIARGVILEGKPPGRATYWGTGKEAGSMLSNIGRPRQLFRPGNTAVEALSPEHRELVAGPNSPTIHVIDAAKALKSGDGAIGEKSKSPSVSPGQEQPTERVEIEALRQAQKYGTPVAVALAGDYDGVPFKVPRKFIVLGWFWVVDAWLEPISPRTQATGAEPSLVAWRFRFEWCSPQAQPWWTPQSDPPRIPTPTIAQANGAMTSSSLQLHSEHRTVYRPGITDSNAEHFATCPACDYASKIVYRNSPICLNEQCPEFYRQIPSIGRDAEQLEGPETSQPSEVVAARRIEPSHLSLQLRPPLPSGEEREGRKWAGKEWWKAWVCDDCGQANERRSWSKWDCQACGRVIQFPRKHYDAFFLRDPSRPVCDGPRQDDGMPNWPFDTKMAWTLFKDDIKVIKHGVDVEDGLGLRAEVFHALNTEGKMSHVASNLVLRGLQSQGREELPLTRYVQPNATVRPSEQYLSPFYTMLCGDEAPVLDHFPVGPPVPWTQCLQQTLDAIDLLNERVGRMWPDTKERFNSLLIAAFPPELPSGLAPHIVLQPGEYLGLLFLGSDGEIRFKAASSTNKRFGALKYQHGDVIGVKAGVHPIEIVLKPEDFGFVCLGRMTYKPHAPDTEAEEMDLDFPALPTPAQVRPAPRPQPRESLPASSSAVTLVPPSSTSKGKSKTKLLEKASVDGWYIGSRPVNPQEPLRSLAILEERRDVNVPTPPRTFRAPNDDIDPTANLPPKWTGVVEITVKEMDSVTLRETGPVESLEDKKAGKKRGKKGKGEDQEETAEPAAVAGLKGKGKGKRASTAASTVPDEMDVVVKTEPGMNVAAEPKKITTRGRGRGGRSSMGSTRGIATPPIVSSPAAKTAGAGRGRGRGKGRVKSAVGGRGVEASSGPSTPLASSPLIGEVDAEVDGQ